MVTAGAQAAVSIDARSSALPFTFMRAAR